MCTDIMSKNLFRYNSKVQMCPGHCNIGLLCIQASLITRIFMQQSIKVNSTVKFALEKSQNN